VSQHGKLAAMICSSSGILGAVMREIDIIAASQDIREVRQPFVMIWLVALAAFMVGLVGWYVFLWLA